MEPIQTYLEEERQDFFEYSKFKSKLTALAGDWSTEITKTDTRRQLRLLEIDVDAMRESEELEPDETFIPMRVIDQNIRNEQPAYVSFLTQANKLISMTDKVYGAQFDTALGENEFTKGLKYHGWELPWYREFDGTQLHGWDCVEVVYDSSKPLNVGIEHVGHDRLLFPLDIQDIQSSPFLARTYTMTSVQLKKMVSQFGFNAEQVRLLLEIKKASRREASDKIYKVYFKYDGIVYVGWTATEHTSDWLKPPVPFYNGVRNKVMVEQPAVGTGGQLVIAPQPPMVTWEDAKEEMYPIFMLRYNESENLQISACKGRGFLDCHKQEAQTAIVTGFVNGLVRSQNVYASPRNPQGSGILKYQSDMNIQHGRMFTEPVDFFTMPYPDAASILGGLQYFETRNANDINQTTDALRKKKGEKTAYEYQLAEQDKALLSSVQMTLLSAHIREVYTYVWRIVKSQALQGKIPFLVQQAMDAPDGTTVYTNNIDFLNRDFDIRAAGDIEVIQKAQRIDRMKMDWPVVVNTPLAQQFLIDLLKLQYPEFGEKYATIILQGDQGKQLVATLSQMLGEMLKKYPDELQTAPPEVQQQMQMINQQVQQYLGGGQPQ